VTVLDRFLTKIDGDGPIPAHRPELGPCTIWTGAKTGAGYGNLWVNGQYLGAHRVAWTLFVGPVPDDLEIDHLCRNRACVKACADSNGPAHLEPTTHRENDLRGTGRSARNAEKEQCLNGHPFDEANTRCETNRFGLPSRRCRKCHAARQRARKARLREARVAA
jgi:hypothetical protein